MLVLLLNDLTLSKLSSKCLDKSLNIVKYSTQRALFHFFPKRASYKHWNLNEVRTFNMGPNEI